MPTKEIYKNNSEHYIEQAKKYYAIKEHCKMLRKQKYEQNKKLKKWVKAILIYEFYMAHGDLHKKFDKITTAIRYKKNKQIYNKQQREKVAFERKNNSLFKLKENTRNLICASFRMKGIRKNTKTFNMLGCTPEQFKQHIESQFDSNMSWDNYGSYWSIDHIIPIASAITENDLLKINHFSNLRPLEKIENIKKGAKLVEKRF